MPEYKLLYFPIRGKAQAIRLLLLDQGVPFKDETITYSEWPKVKPTLHFGQLPAFYIDGVPLVQSYTILRYLAREHGLYGSSNMEAAHIDMLNDSVEDIYSKYSNMIYRNYEEGKEEYTSKTMPDWLGKFEKWLQGKNEGKGYLMGEKMCYADYNLFQFLDSQLILSATCLDKLPLLKAYHARVAARPKIAEFLKSEINTKRNVNGNGRQ